MHILAVHMLGEGDMTDRLSLAVHFEFRKIYSAAIGRLAEKRWRSPKYLPSSEVRHIQAVLDRPTGLLDRTGTLQLTEASDLVGVSQIRLHQVDAPQFDRCGLAMADVDPGVQVVARSTVRSTKSLRCCPSQLPR